MLVPRRLDAVAGNSEYRFREYLFYARVVFQVSSTWRCSL